MSSECHNDQELPPCGAQRSAHASGVVSSGVANLDSLDEEYLRARLARLSCFAGSRVLDENTKHL